MKMNSIEGQQINLKWKSFHSNIVTGFEDLWEEEGLVDVTLASDGRCLKAHKVILSASSPFFKEIFLMNPCQHPVIVLQDVHYSELISILTFVYKGEVNILQENLPLLLRAAETLQIRGLCGRAEYKNGEEDDINCPEALPPPEPLMVEAVLSPPGSPAPKRRKPSPSLEAHQRKHSPTPTAPSTGAAAILQVSTDRIKSEPRPESPAISEASGDEPIGGIEPQTLDSDPSQKSSKNYPFPPFPCPFCDRAYTSWGFRRRHIKACHTRTQRLPCKWCLEVLPSHTEWESHVCKMHSLSRTDARNGLLILEEAEVVLQIPQPTRLDALVTMIKDQKEDGQDSGVQW